MALPLTDYNHLQKTENFYMQEQGKHMKKIDVELFFTIDEKNNSIQLTDKGIDLVSGNEERDFFIMPDIGAEIAKLEKDNSNKEELVEKKDTLIREYSIKSERIHSINQLLKAYTLFEKEVEYVVMDGKVKIVDEETDQETDYQIVGPYEANLELGLISIASPIAKALIGKEKGSSVEVKTPSGSKNYEIISIEVIKL